MAFDRVTKALSALRGRDEDGDRRLRRGITMPSAAAYVHWGFAGAVDGLEWDLTVHRDPGESVGEYLALFNGSIDGSSCYLGLQTNVMRPGVGGTGKGLIFSTWWSFDAADARVAENGFVELGTHEGNFVGVRRPYRWTTGDYRVALTRGEPEVVAGRTMDWFALSIQPTGLCGPGIERPAPTGDPVSIGQIRFPRRRSDHAAQIEPGGLMFLEVYSGATRWIDVTPWHLDVMAFADRVRCPSGWTEYPRPYARRVENTNTRYLPDIQRIELRIGVGDVRPDPPERWP